MTKIAILRTAEPLPSEPELAGARALLFRALDGLGETASRAWRRFWGRVVKLEPGELLEVECRIPRNPRFHRKMFALLQVGFDAWEPARKHKTYKGRPVEKNFDRFRRDVVILAGFYNQHFDLRGRMVLEAKSLSYASMDGEEFDRVYSAVADVLLREVLKTYAGREELDAVVDRIAGFL